LTAGRAVGKTCKVLELLASDAELEAEGAS
jgi:hypothetical protein